MRKTVWFVVCILALLITNPAFAAEKTPASEQIFAVPPDRTFPANTPFHIMHGWWITPPNPIPGQWTFTLEVDGVYIPPSYTTHHAYVLENGELWLQRFWTFNFEDGMTGQHTFRSHWIAPCSAAVDMGLTDYCVNPNADFEFSSYEFIITFTE